MTPSRNGKFKGHDQKQILRRCWSHRIEDDGGIQSADQVIGVPREGDVSLLAAAFPSETSLLTLTKQIGKWVLGK